MNGGLYVAHAMPRLLGQLTALTELTVDGNRTHRVKPPRGAARRLRNATRLHVICRIRYVPESLGNLVCLTSLVLGSCFEVRRLPESLGLLTALTSLVIGQCHALTALPESLGQLVKLTVLTVRAGGQIARLPDSLGH